MSAEDFKVALRTFTAQVKRAKSADEVRSLMEPALRAADNAGDYKASGRLFRSLARHSAVLDRDLVREVVIYGDPTDLLQNPSIDRDLLREASLALAEGIVELASSKKVGAAESTDVNAAALASLGAEGFFTYSSPAGEALSPLLPHKGPPYIPYYATQGSSFALLGAKDTPEEVLVQMYENGSDKLKEKVLRHANAGPALFRQVLRDKWSEDRLKELCEIPRAIEDEEVRGVLYTFARYRDGERFAALAPGIPPQEFATYLHHLLEASPVLAADVLKNASAEQRSLLDAQSLTEFLAHPRAEARLAAIAALHGTPGKVVEGAAPVVGDSEKKQSPRMAR